MKPCGWWAYLVRCLVDRTNGVCTSMSLVGPFVLSTRFFISASWWDRSQFLNRTQSSVQGFFVDKPRSLFLWPKPQRPCLFLMKFHFLVFSTFKDCPVVWPPAWSAVGNVWSSSRLSPSLLSAGFEAGLLICLVIHRFKALDCPWYHTCIIRMLSRKIRKMLNYLSSF